MKKAERSRIAFALSRRDLETIDEPYRWQREDAYDERLNCYDTEGVHFINHSAKGFD